MSSGGGDNYTYKGSQGGGSSGGYAPVIPTHRKKPALSDPPIRRPGNFLVIRTAMVATRAREVTAATVMIMVTTIARGAGAAAVSGPNVAGVELSTIMLRQFGVFAGNGLDL